LFLVWVFTRPYVRKTDMFYFGRRLAYVACGCSFGLGLIGVGLFTSVPATTVTFLLTGWFAVREAKAPPVVTEPGTVPMSALPLTGSAG
jgi:hypothetical protein